MSLVTIKPCGGGVNKDLMPSELAPNQWSDALNMRFANGFATRRYGIEAVYDAPLITPYAIETYVTPSVRFIVEAGIQKVYVDDGSTQTEITRYTDGVVIGSITFVGTTATLNTTTAHGRTTGQTVSVFGAFPEAYNGTFVITVTDADTFTYTMLSNPGGNATEVGQYSYNVTSNFTGSIDDKWSLCVLNGVLIANNPVDGPYYWNGDTSTRLRKLPGWPVGQKAYSMHVFKNYIIGIAPTISGTFQPHLVMWSESAEPGAVPTTWVAATTNDAGDTPQAAEASGALVCGEQLGETFVIYGIDSRFGMEWIGGNDVFRIYRMPWMDGIHSRDCVVNTPKGHVFLTNGDVRVHRGGDSESIVEGRIRRWLFNTMDTTYSERSFLAVNPQRSEVWVVFPKYGDEVPTMVAAWNWNDNTWGVFEIPQVTCAAMGLVAPGLGGAWQDDPEPWISDPSTWAENQYSQAESRLILGHPTAIGLADVGTMDLGASIDWRLEKRGTSLDDTDSLKVISRSRPHVDAQVGTALTVYHTATMTADAEPTYGTGVSYTVSESGSGWASKFSKAGRYLAVKYEGSDDAIVSMRAYDVEFTKQGRF